MAEQAALVRTWRVGRRKVTVTMPQVRSGQVLHAAFEWTPDMPRRLSQREWKQQLGPRTAVRHLP